MLYDLVRKTHVRSCDVLFMEDETIENIDKVKKTTPGRGRNPSGIDLIQLLVHNMKTIDDDVLNGKPYDYFDDQ